MKRIILITILIFAVNIVFGQIKNKKEKIDSGCNGIMNGKAVDMPKPSKETLENCNCKFYSELQQVIVQITISEKGIVEEATAISGHPFLRQISEQAARNSRFTPSIIGCEPQKAYSEIVYWYNLKENIITYNSPELRFTRYVFNAGVVNKKAIYLPKPMVRNIVHPKHLRLSENEVVKIEIVIDEQGNVINTNVISGHPLLRSVCESAARKAKFPSTWDVGKIRVNGILVYTIKPNGKVEM